MSTASLLIKRAGRPPGKHDSVAAEAKRLARLKRYKPVSKWKQIERTKNATDWLRETINQPELFWEMNESEMLNKNATSAKHPLIPKFSSSTILSFNGSTGKWLTTPAVLAMGMCCCPDCATITNIESGEVMGIDLYCKTCKDFKLIITQ